MSEILQFKFEAKEFRLEITEDDARDLERSASQVHALWEIETQIRHIERAQIELEMELARWCFSEMYGVSRIPDLLSARCAVEYRILAQLSTIRSYHDYLEKRVKSGIFPGLSWKKVHLPYSTAYDQHLFYRLINDLRNIVQHSKSLLSEISIGWENMERAEAKGAIEYRVDLRLSRDALLAEGKVKPALRDEIAVSGYNDFDLKSCLRLYTDLVLSLATVSKAALLDHSHAREILNDIRGRAITATNDEGFALDFFRVSKLDAGAKAYSIEYLLEKLEACTGSRGHAEPQHRHYSGKVKRKGKRYSG